MLKVYEIVPGLYQRGGLWERPAEKKKELIEALNLKVIIGLAGPYDEDLASQVEYHHYPITDHKIKDYDSLRRLAVVGFVAIKRGDSVLVYCEGGRNRSSLLSALIVKGLRDCSGAEAAQIVCKARPNALANPYFETFLRELQ